MYDEYGVMSWGNEQRERERERLCVNRIDPKKVCDYFVYLLVTREPVTDIIR